MNKFKDFFKISIILSVFFFGTLAVAPAGAASLNLTLNPYPDIFSDGISVNYNANANTFTAIGEASKLNNDGSLPLETIVNGSFNLTAIIDNSGFLSLGNLIIGGTVPTLSDYDSGTLLTGDITAFGYENENDPFEFLFSLTGGDAAGLYGGIGSTGGVILSSIFTDFTGFFSSDWSSFGVSDTGTPVPEPVTMLLLGSGLIGLAGFMRKR